jgi:hypothetical protein
MMREKVIESMIALATELRHNEHEKHVYYNLVEVMRNLYEYAYFNDIYICEADLWFMYDDDDAADLTNEQQ